MNNRMDFLLRKNKGKAIMADYVNNMSRILQCSCSEIAANVLPLDNSDSIRNMHMEIVKSIGDNLIEDIVFFEFKSKKFEKNIIGMHNIKFENNKCYLITKISEYCGVIEYDLHSLISHVNEIIEYDGDGCIIASADGINGIAIDMTVFDNENIYSVIVY